MNTYFSICSTVFYQRKYMDYLLAHYEELNMPYSFSVAFSFMASPVMLGQECILCLDDDGEAIGAFSYIHGTGEGNYEDRHIVQLQVAFLEESRRRTPLFLRGLQFLKDHLEGLQEEVRELVFWTKPDAYAIRLFGKFAVQTSIPGTAFGGLLAFRVTVADLHAYLARYMRRIKL